MATATAPPVQFMHPVMMYAPGPAAAAAAAAAQQQPQPQLQLQLPGRVPTQPPPGPPPPGVPPGGSLPAPYPPPSAYHPPPRTNAPPSMYCPMPQQQQQQPPAPQQQQPPPPPPPPPVAAAGHPPTHPGQPQQQQQQQQQPHAPPPMHPAYYVPSPYYQYPPAQQAPQQPQQQPPQAQQPPPQQQHAQQHPCQAAPAPMPQQQQQQQQAQQVPQAQQPQATSGSSLIKEGVGYQPPEEPRGMRPKSKFTSKTSEVAAALGELRGMRGGSSGSAAAAPALSAAAAAAAASAATPSNGFANRSNSNAAATTAAAGNRGSPTSQHQHHHHHHHQHHQQQQPRRGGGGGGGAAQPQPQQALQQHTLPLQLQQPQQQQQPCPFSARRELHTKPPAYEEDVAGVYRQWRTWWAAHGAAPASAPNLRSARNYHRTPKPAEAVLRQLAFGQRLAANFNFEPYGLHLVPSFVSLAEEAALVGALAREDGRSWTDVPHRGRSMQFGYAYDATQDSLRGVCAPLPPYLQDLAARVAEKAKTDKMPNQVVVCEHLPGQGQALHCDSHYFGEFICTVSLLSDATMCIVNAGDQLAVDHGGIGTGEALLLHVQHGSMLSFSSQIRWKWQHGIPPSMQDLDTNLNVVPRTKRLTLTFRYIDPELYKQRLQQAPKGGKMWYG